MRLDLSFQEDYCDAAHLNYKGAVKFSQDLAAVLAEKYVLPDHRTEETFSKWDGYWEEFVTDYSF